MERLIGGRRVEVRAKSGHWSRYRLIYWGFLYRPPNGGAGVYGLWPINPL